MKTCTLLFVIAIAVSANAQDKPRVFVQGKGSENVSSNGAEGGDHHGAAWGSTIESMKVGKNFHKDCSDVIVTINQANADYIVMMNRESQNGALLRNNSQIQVANKAGDIIGTKATRTVGNASKDACKLIVADWQAYGHINARAAPAVPPSRPATVQPAVLKPRQQPKSSPR
jgi:hypothetical protein